MAGSLTFSPAGHYSVCASQQNTIRTAKPEQQCSEGCEIEQHHGYGGFGYSPIHVKFTEPLLGGIP